MRPSTTTVSTTTLTSPRMGRLSVLPILLLLLLLLLLVPSTRAFLSRNPSTTRTTRATTLAPPQPPVCDTVPVPVPATRTFLASETNHHDSSIATTRPPSNRSYIPLRQHLQQQQQQQALTTVLFGIMVHVMTTFGFLVSSSPAHAYSDSDYASETVTSVIQSLEEARGNAPQTFRVYEDIAGIITEGKGVGGNINYQGVQLDRGYVSDEDTAIYNPGLTLLTESEKERLVEAIVDSRKAGLASSTSSSTTTTTDSWTDNNQLAYDFLKTKLDPLHMRELKGYLSIVPFYGALLYMGVLAVQQLVREWFAPAYMVAAVLFVGPMVLLVALGS